MLLFHITECCLASVDNGFETDSGHEINFFIIVFVSFLGAGYTDIVDPDIQAAKLLVYVFCKTVIVLRIHNIKGFIVHRTILGEGFCGLFQFFFVACADGNFGAFFQECLRGSVSDSLAASGDYDGFSG